MHKVLWPAVAALSVFALAAAATAELPQALLLALPALVVLVWAIVKMTTYRAPTYNLKGFGR